MGLVRAGPQTVTGTSLSPPDSGEGDAKRHDHANPSLPAAAISGFAPPRCRDQLNPCLRALSLPPGAGRSPYGSRLRATPPSVDRLGRAAVYAAPRPLPAAAGQLLPTCGPPRRIGRWPCERRRIGEGPRQKTDSISKSRSVFCDMVEKLGDEEILIKNLTLKNLYVATGAPRILVLVTEAEQLSRAPSKMEQWKPVKDVIESIFKKCNVELNHEATRFLGFIVMETFTVKNLRKYPLDWDIQTKRDYLLALAAKQAGTRSTMRHAIAWPRVDGKLPEVLDQIIIHQNSLSNTLPYSTNVPLDYIRLIRNTYKHFYKLPYHIKEALGNHQDGFINCIEQWTPDIWKNIYDMIGWP